MMELKELRLRIDEFEKKAGFDRTEFDKLVTMLKKELVALEASDGVEGIVNHQLTDMLVLILQIANRYNTDFDKELAVWFKKSEKYLF